MLSNLWKKIKSHWHHMMIPLAGALQIVETQWSLINVYFGKWAGALLVSIGLLKYGLNMYAAKKSMEAEKNDNPSVD